jgi:hypothetical protein
VLFEDSNINLKAIEKILEKEFTEKSYELIYSIVAGKDLHHRS